MKRIAIVLSGCGVRDGSEIHEATLTLLALVKAGAAVEFAAPDIPQAAVVNHRSNAPITGDGRSVLVESARIARGSIMPLADLHTSRVDAVIFPGGFGAAANLCDFASKGAACSVNPDVERVIRSAHAAGKPMGFICIAPVLAARVLGSASLRPRLTIGHDADTAAAIAAMGGQHVDCDAEGVVIDAANRLISTPAYMLARNIAEVEVGITRLVGEVLRLCEAPLPTAAR